MKQYAYIFHPNNAAQGEWTVEGMDLEHECVSKKDGPVVVCSIEDLRELFKAGRSYGREDGSTTPLTGHNHPSFEEYLQEKEIKL